MLKDDELLKAQAEQWWSFRERCIEYSKEYGIATIRSLILINGAAIIATLTFASNVKKESLFALDLTYVKFSICAFILGLLLATLAGVMGYFNFQYNAGRIPDPNELYNKVAEKKVTRDDPKIGHTTFIAVGVTIGSFILFAVGSIFALVSLVHQ